MIPDDTCGICYHRKCEAINCHRQDCPWQPPSLLPDLTGFDLAAGPDRTVQAQHIDGKIDQIKTIGGRDG